MNKVNVHEHIGYKIKKLREEQKLSKVDLAKGICSASYLTRVEKGERCPTSSILRELSYRLKVSPDYLFDLAETSNVLEIKNFIRNSIKLIERGDIVELNEYVKLNKDKYVYPSIYDKQTVEALEIHAKYFLNKQYDKAIIELDRILYYTHKNDDKLTDIEIAIINDQALFLMMQDKYQEAYDILTKLQEYIDNPMIFLNTYGAFSLLYIRLVTTEIMLGKYDEALVTVNDAINKLIEQNFIIHLSQLYYLKAEIMYHLNNLEGFELWLNKAKTLDELTGNQKDKSKEIVIKRISNL